MTGRVVTDTVTFGDRTVEQQAFCAYAGLAMRSRASFAHVCVYPPVVVPDSNTPGAAGNIGLGLSAHGNPSVSPGWSCCFNYSSSPGLSFRQIGTPLVENLRAKGLLGPDRSFNLQMDRTGNNAAITLGVRTGQGSLTPSHTTYNVLYPEVLGRVNLLGESCLSGPMLTADVCSGRSR